MVSPLHSPGCVLAPLSPAVPPGMSGAAAHACVRGAVAWPLPDGSVSGLRGEQAAGFASSVDVSGLTSPQPPAGEAASSVTWGGVASRAALVRGGQCV